MAVWVEQTGGGGSGCLNLLFADTVGAAVYSNGTFAANTTATWDGVGFFGLTPVIGTFSLRLDNPTTGDLATVTSSGSGCVDLHATTPVVTPTAGDAQVILNWTAAGPASTHLAVAEYQISRGTTPGGESALATVAGNVLTYTDSAAVNGTTYYYKVKAVVSASGSVPGNTNLNSALSAEVSATPAAAVALELWGAIAL